MDCIYSLDLQRYKSVGKSHVTRFLFWFRLQQTTKSKLLEIISKLVIIHYRDNATEGYINHKANVQY